MTSKSDKKPLHKNEAIKAESSFLRGTLASGLTDESTGAISAPDQQLIKFHGVYQQDDRDQRKERRKLKQEKAFSFMARVRVPGGICSPEQWLKIDALGDSHANGSIRLTTRQAFQLHGILKGELKPALQEINAALLDTIAACGDVNRNVMCNPNPHQSEIHQQAQDVADAISEHLTPRTGAYHEIWLDKERITPEPKSEEPIYGKTYLPRKFKIVVAVPPSNDVDVYAHCLGFIAVIENDKLVGFNISVGGGMGMSHGKEHTYPRLADVIGFCPLGKAVEVAEQVVKIQRDHGDRTDRHHARLKYTIDDRGVEWFTAELNKRLGWDIEAARPFEFEHNGDRYGWCDGTDGKSHYTLFIQNGRVVDRDGYPLRTGLREIAKVHTGDFRLTANQNVIIGGVTPGNKSRIETLLKQHHLADASNRSALRLNSMACVALPTCGLALAESERYLPELIDELDTVIDDCGLRSDAITIRMTGCPNGCARPYIAEIALVGRAPGKYNIYLGGGFAGQRLNKLFRTSVKDAEIVNTLRPVIEAYARDREDGERFGDFVIRAGYVKATTEGRDFHANIESS